MLTDFGVARLISDETLTTAGAVVGTPPYTAPEQEKQSSRVDHRADIYSVGVIAWELLTGTFPREGHLRLTGIRKDPPGGVEKWVSQALARDPEKRFPSCGAMIQELETISGRILAGEGRKDSLHEACEKGDLHLVEAHLERGADPNRKNVKGEMPLQAAASRGHSQVVSLLLKNGADPNARDGGGRVPLEAAVVARSSPSIVFLLEHGADPNALCASRAPLLHLAVLLGNETITGLLLDAKADAGIRDEYGYNALKNAVRIGREDLVDMLLSGGADINAETKNGGTLLDVIVCSSDTAKRDIVLHLLSRGACSSDYEARERDIVRITELPEPTNFFLRHAILAGDQEDVLRHLSLGADPRAHVVGAASAGQPAILRLLLDRISKSGKRDTILNESLLAAIGEKCSKEVVEILLDLGADKNTQGKGGFTPLYQAVLYGHEGIVSVLLERGSDVSVPTSDGMTPLHKAASGHRGRIAELLLAKGADTRALDKDGRTPFWWGSDDKNMRGLLLRYGAEDPDHKGTRFVNNGEGTVTDKETRLTWVRNPKTAGLLTSTPSFNNYHKSGEAYEACGVLCFAGHRDWRLPSVAELETLLDKSRRPAISPLFTLQEGYYFSSTIEERKSFVVDFHAGEVLSFPLDNDGWLPGCYRSLYALPVRGSRHLDGETRFEDNDDGTVTDRKTGLRWVKDIFEAGFGRGLTWHEAKQLCEHRIPGLGSGWRLPTKEEMMALLDPKVQPAIDPIFSIHHMLDDYWTSSECGFLWGKAWVVDCEDAICRELNKSWEAYVRPVHD